MLSYHYPWNYPESERLLDRYGCKKDDKGKWVDPWRKKAKNKKRVRMAV